MPLDHYVSQVYLKNFYSTELGELMFAIKKADQNLFTPNSQSVCRIEEGSTNIYLSDERKIEEFLKGIEPKYNSSASKVLNCQFDSESVYVIAGFVSYVITCSPAGMRIHSELFRRTVVETTRILDKHKRMPPPPPRIGGENLTELLESGIVAISIDGKYTQAHGISSILSLTNILGNSAWEILINPFKDSPFFSSDYPVAIERSENSGVLNRIVPLTPFLAVRIKPDIHIDKNYLDLSFSGFRYKRKQLSHSEVRKLNQLFVQCAESVVFFSQMEKWILQFVKRNSQFRIEPNSKSSPHGKDAIPSFTQLVSKYVYE